MMMRFVLILAVSGTLAGCAGDGTTAATAASPTSPSAPTAPTGTTPSAPTFTLTVNVVDASRPSQGIVGAAITVVDSTNSIKSVLADSAGTTSFTELRQGSYGVRVYYPGYATSDQVVALTANQTVSVSLVRVPASVSGIWKGTIGSQKLVFSVCSLAPCQYEIHSGAVLNHSRWPAPGTLGEDNVVFIYYGYVLPSCGLALSGSFLTPGLYPHLPVVNSTFQFDGDPSALSQDRRMVSSFKGTFTGSTASGTARLHRTSENSTSFFSCLGDLDLTWTAKKQ